MGRVEWGVVGWGRALADIDPNVTDVLLKPRPDRKQRIS